jgi:hypothetical protein
VSRRPVAPATTDDVRAVRRLFAAMVSRNAARAVEQLRDLHALAGRSAAALRLVDAEGAPYDVPLADLAAALDDEARRLERSLAGGDR